MRYIGSINNDIKLVIILTMLVLLVSCVPQVPSDQINTFSIATQEFTKQAADGYELIDESTIQRKIIDLASDPESVISEQSFEGVTGITEGDIKNDIALRIKLLSLLNDYAKALGGLSTANFSEDIDKASKDLYGSLVGLNKTIASTGISQTGISDDNLSIVATVVNSIGKYIAEKKRFEAIKEIVIQSDPIIQESTSLIERDIQIFPEFVRQNYNAIATEYAVYYQDTADQQNLDERIKSLEQIQVLYSKGDAAIAFYGEVILGAQKLSEAHKTLKDTLEKDQLSSVDLAREIGQLVDIAKSIKNFNESLTKQSD